MDINITWATDPVALILAVVAIYFSWHQIRRSDHVVLRIEEIRCSYPLREGENHERQFIELHVRVRNLGIALHAPSMVIDFRKDGGRWQAKIKARPDIEAESGEFVKGMIAVFEMKSYELNEGTIVLLSHLMDPKQQDAHLSVFSQGFLAKTFRIGGWRDCLSRRWNRPAYWVNRNVFAHRAGTTKDKVPIINAPTVIPIAPQLDFAVMSFVNAVRSNETKN